MLLTIRPWRAGDAVDALLDADADPLWVAQGHALHGPDVDGVGPGGVRRRRTLVAHLGTDLVGAATVATNAIHAGRLSCAVEVAAPHRRRGIGRALLAAVRPQPLPLAGKVRPGSAAHAFVAAAGGSAYQHCPGVQADAQDPALRRWCAAAPAGQLGPLAGALAEAWVEQYLWVHEDWSPVSSTAALRDLADGPVGEIDPELSTGAWVDGRLAATVWAFSDGADGLVVVAETQRRDEPGGTRLLTAALARSLTRAAAAGRRTVEFDGHDTDPHLAPLLATLPRTGANPLLLVELPPD